MVQLGPILFCNICDGVDAVRCPSMVRLQISFTFYLLSSIQILMGSVLDIAICAPHPVCVERVVYQTNQSTGPILVTYMQCACSLLLSIFGHCSYLKPDWTMYQTSNGFLGVSDYK